MGLVKVKKPTKSSESTFRDTKCSVQEVSHKTSDRASSATLKKTRQSYEASSESKLDNESKKTDKDAKDDEQEEASVGPLDSVGIMSSIREGLVKQQSKQTSGVRKSAKSGGLSLLGGYADSDSDGSSESD